MKTFDLVVLGGGSGGLAASRRAAALYKKKVLLVDKTVLGGTCVNYGCIPKKMMYTAACLHEEAKWLGSQGSVQFRWGLFKEKRDKYIARLNGMYVTRNTNDSVVLERGEATLHGKTVRVNQKEYTGENVLVATGSYPLLPRCPGGSLCITSDDFFRLKENPKTVAIIGAGYIAIETAFVLVQFGSKVTLISRSPGVLRVFDSMIKERVQTHLQLAGISLFDSAKVEQIEKTGAQKKITFSQNDHTLTLSVDEVISAIGRAPNTSFIPENSLETDKNGFLSTSPSFETSHKHVFAIGDVTMHEHMLTPVAIFAGRKLADFLYGHGSPSIKELVKAVPTVVFSHPPCGSVGYSEQEAQTLSEPTASLSIKVAHPSSLFSPGAVNTYKFVYGQCTDTLYGIHMHGYECDEALQGFSALIRHVTKLASLTEYLETIGSTWSELLMGLSE
ncbi:glutathione reductase (NADPH) [Nematocida sp. AWRm77]|nr:glutathione reductase (NADPH) [Nematocida sp. AWRm77]